MSYPRAGCVQVYKTGITIIDRDHLGIPMCAKASCLLGAPSIMSPVIRSLLKGLPESGVLKREKSMRASWRLNRTLAALSSRLHLCPWYFECVVVYAWHECHLNGAGAEAVLLIELLVCLTILLRGTPDSLNGVQRCRCRIGYLSEEAALHFCR